jgi:hypothetical protein
MVEALEHLVCLETGLVTGSSAGAVYVRPTETGEYSNRAMSVAAGFTPAFKFKQKNFLAVLERGHKARGYGDIAPFEYSPVSVSLISPCVSLQVCPQ